LATGERARKLSPKTVEYLLRSTSARLGIASGARLDRALPQRTDVGAAGVNQAGVRRDR